jgi:chemotaxis protein MotB
MGQFALPASVVALVALLPGCQWGSSGRLSSADMQNRMLAEQNQAQLQEIENLKAHNRTVENQLIQAEEELAELDQRVGVDRKQIANYQRERRRVRGQVDTLVDGARRGAAVPDPRLEQLSRRYDWLIYDAETGVSRFDTDLLFDSGEAELRPDARMTLDELASFLKSPEASELRVMIVGHTDSRQIAKRPTREKYPDNWHLSAARALAVADYLRHRGVREEQLGVAGYGRQQPIADNKDGEERQFNRRVEVFVMGPETPVVGWTETAPSVY